MSFLKNAALVYRCPGAGDRHLDRRARRSLMPFTLDRVRGQFLSFLSSRPIPGRIGFPKAVRVTRRLRPFTMKVANAFPTAKTTILSPHPCTQSSKVAPRSRPIANHLWLRAPCRLRRTQFRCPRPPMIGRHRANLPKAGTAPSAPVPSGPRAPDSKGRRLIDKELPNSSAEERDLWHETTRDLPLNDLRELLRLRAQIGRLSPPWSDIHHSPNQQTAPAPSSPMTGNGPFPSAPSDGTGPATAEPDPGRVLSATMAAIAQARQVLLNNIANAQTNGYKRRLVSFESAADRPMTSSLPENPLQIRFGLPADVGARLVTGGLRHGSRKTCGHEPLTRSGDRRSGILPPR